MTRLRVDLERLAELVDRLAAYEQRLKQTHDEVVRRVADMHVTWHGDAATAQQAAQDEWSVALEQVHSSLAALRRISATAQANYHAAIEANRRMWAL